MQKIVDGNFKSDVYLSGSFPPLVFSLISSTSISRRNSIQHSWISTDLPTAAGADENKLKFPSMMLPYVTFKYFTMTDD